MKKLQGVSSSFFVVLLLVVLAACSSPTSPNNGGGTDNPSPPGGGANPTPLPANQVITQTSTDGTFRFTLKQTQPARESIAPAGQFTGIWFDVKIEHTSRMSYCFIIRENVDTPLDLSKLAFCGNGNVRRPVSIPGGALIGPGEAFNVMKANLMPIDRERIPWLTMVAWVDSTRMDQGFPPDWANISFYLGWNLDLPVPTETSGLDGPG